MTDAKMALLELVEQEADSDLVREMLAFAAERMMDMEIEAKTGAPAGTRSPDRLNHRNGYREVSIRGRPQGGSAFAHEVCAALIQELFEVVEPAPGERGGGLQRRRRGCQ